MAFLTFGEMVVTERVTTVPTDRGVGTTEHLLTLGTGAAIARANPVATRGARNHVFFASTVPTEVTLDRVVVTVDPVAVRTVGCVLDAELIRTRFTPPEVTLAGRFAVHNALT